MNEFTAVDDSVRVGNEPVGLPEFGERVLGCTVRRKPMPTRDVFEAFAACGFNEPAAAGFIMNGLAFPAPVLKLLSARGIEQEYTRSTLVEMYRLRIQDRQQGQQKFVGEWAWASDAMPLDGEFDTLPTHWAPAPEFEP